MFFKIEPNTPLAASLREFNERVKKVRKHVFNIAQDMSDVKNPSVAIENGYITGFVAGIQRNKVDASWTRIKVPNSFKKFYKPRRPHPLWDEMNSSPILESDLSALFHLEQRIIGGKFYRLPGLKELEDGTFIVEIQDPWALSVPIFPEEMIEILSSEYHKLLNQ